MANYYALSSKWTTITGNPTDRHAFCPVHATRIIEVNKVVDAASRKYLAYDSDNAGSEIRLYYTDDLDGVWTPYSGNPILGPSANHYRWPSVAYTDGTFHMFLGDSTDGKAERWTSADGITFAYQEDVCIGGAPGATNPFIWLNPNDSKWYLYWRHVGVGYEVRSHANIVDLDTASDSTTLPGPSPTMMSRDGVYWLLVEGSLNGVPPWVVRAHYSSSPDSGFTECANSPILMNDEACPMHLLSPDGSKAYLFTNRDSANWYQDTRQIYLHSWQGKVINSSDDCIRILDDPLWALAAAIQYAGRNTNVAGDKNGGGMRFLNVTIPKGATIDEAYLTLRCSSSRSGVTVKTRISAEAVDNALTFADDAAAFDARWANRTAAVDWDAIPAWTLDTDYDSPEIKSVIQAIVDRAGWVSGNALVIFWDDYDGRGSAVPSAWRGCYSYDGSPDYAPKLVVLYTAPPPVPAHGSMGDQMIAAGLI